MKTGRTGAVTVLAGALALSAFTAPAAQAADTGITVSGIVVNGGKPIVVGTSEVKRPSVTFRITLPAGYSTADPFAYDAEPFLYHGTSTAAKGAQSDALFPSYTCYEKSARVADCEGDLYVEPRYRLDSNSDATTWKIGIAARLFKTNGQLKAEEYLATSGRSQIRRWAKATVNAAPEPVKKGKPITVTGSLTRADWVKHTYTGVADASVKLQFRKKGAAAYSTVKTVKSSATGALKTTVTASADGYWRWSFGGWSTTGAATSSVDFVDVN
ncbi:hypothetical protein [Streptomyces sp. RKAG290]|uniref:hypothetical protein n=1 Tax=Streptomyces sp. RKAG290 TaxID=2888348 RepID=UPI00203332C5|nr:hypothetical protein [Streptomyces sp. RKAG290]MCM2412314.1 hypothetical protein [Streptomyces sp. RKAG290]